MFRHNLQSKEIRIGKNRFQRNWPLIISNLIDYCDQSEHQMCVCFDVLIFFLNKKENNQNDNLMRLLIWYYLDQYISLSALYTLLKENSNNVKRTLSGLKITTICSNAQIQLSQMRRGSMSIFIKRIRSEKIKIQRVIMLGNDRRVQLFWKEIHELMLTCHK